MSEEEKRFRFVNLISDADRSSLGMIHGFSIQVYSQQMSEYTRGRGRNGEAFGPASDVQQVVAKTYHCTHVLCRSKRIDEVDPSTYGFQLAILLLLCALSVGSHGGLVILVPRVKIGMRE